MPTTVHQQKKLGDPLPVSLSVSQFVSSPVTVANGYTNGAGKLSFEGEVRWVPETHTITLADRSKTMSISFGSGDKDSNENLLGEFLNFLTRETEQFNQRHTSTSSER